MYYFSVIEPLRRDFASCVEPTLVPNYLPGEITCAVSLRRQELEKCRAIGESLNDYGESRTLVFRLSHEFSVLSLNLMPRVYRTGSLTLKYVKIPEFDSSGKLVSP